MPLKFTKDHPVDKEGRFTILDEKPLFIGGQGVIYLASDNKLNGRTVVVKIFKPELLEQNPQFFEYFQQEIQVLCRCQHPNIVDILDQGTLEDAEGTPCFFVVLEYIEDGNKFGEKFSLEEVLEIGAQTASALKLLHKEGVIHRDVKPENILIQKVDDRIVAKLADLGLVKYFDPDHPSQIGHSSVMGTRIYACREQFGQEDDFDHSVDIYSLAKTIYSFITGESPVKPLKPIEEKDFQNFPDLPRKFIQTLIKATADNPAERYRSLDDFTTDLAQSDVVEIEPVEGDEPKPPAVLEPKPPVIAEPKNRSYKTIFYGLLTGIILFMGISYFADLGVLDFQKIVADYKHRQLVKQEKADEEIRRQKYQELMDTIDQLESWRTEKDWDKILDWAENNDRREAHISLLIGEAMVEKGQIDDGIQLMLEANLANGTAEGWLRLARKAAEYNHRETAIAAFREVLAYEPNNQEAKRILTNWGIPVEE